MMREDWVETQLGNVFFITYGKGLPTKKFLDSGFPVFGANGIIGYYSEYKYENEEVLISCRGAASGTINISPKKCFITNNSLIVEIPEGLNVEKKFLYYALKGSNRSKIITGSAQPQVTINNANTLITPLAPLPEQRAIVAKIEKLFSDLDNGIANLRAAKAKLDIYHQAVLKKAFEGGLTKEWRQQRDVNGWQELMISQIGEIVTGNTPSKKNEEFYSSHDYNFYKPTDLAAGHNVFKSIDGLSLKGFQNGRQASKNSILVTCIGATIGKTGLIKSKGCFNQQINAIIPSYKFNPKYIYYQAIGIDFQSQIKKRASSTTLPILNKGKFSTLRMKVCSIEEQDQIVMEIESRLSGCDKLAESIDQSLEKAEALRQSILKKAFSGYLLDEDELAACRRDPDWEPADKLLERIKKNQSVGAKNATTGKSRKANKL
jgi:type I restriction enzyme S subunit